MGIQTRQLDPPVRGRDGKWYSIRVTERQDRDINISVATYEDSKCKRLVEERELDLPYACRRAVSVLINDIDSLSSLVA